MSVPTAVLAALLLAGVAADAVQQLPEGVTLVYSDTAPGVTPPAVDQRSNPRYTPRALRERIQGQVSMDVTVGTDGHVIDVLLTQSVDEDLDRAAIEAVSKWFFRPGTLNGNAVPVRTNVTMAFTLH